MSHPLLQATKHRPYPMPARPWSMFQRWHDLLFAHWEVEPRTIQALLPEGLVVDTFEGKTYLAVVPFRMSGIRLRFLPPMPGTAAFPELNVRVYTRSLKTNQPGVWFLSLDATAPIAIAVARWRFNLPYFRADMHCQPRGSEQAGIDYMSRRRYPADGEASFQAKYEPQGDVFFSKPGTLEYFLTERYCLYSSDRSGKRLYCGEIQHLPWPLQQAQASITQNSMASVHGIQLPESEPHLLFARDLDVLVWNIKEI